MEPQRVVQRLQALQGEDFVKDFMALLHDRMDELENEYIELSSAQITYVSRRLEQVLEPKRDADTGLVQAWTIQQSPTTASSSKKPSDYIHLLKLSTMLREVRCLRVVQRPASQDSPPEADLAIFPSLRALEIVSCKVKNVHCHARQLQLLRVEKADVASLQALLCPKEDAAWPCLELLRLNRCRLQSVDASIHGLTFLRELDLGWNAITSISVSHLPPSLQVIRLNHNRLSVLPTSLSTLPHLLRLELAMNRIESLQGIDELGGVRVLGLAHNLVSTVSQLERLGSLSDLRRLRLMGNPISIRPDYRREVLFYVGEMVELDDLPWDEPELSSMSERRQLSRSPDRSDKWGRPPVYSSSFIQVDSKSSKPESVTQYPSLTMQTSCVRPQLREVYDPPSTLSTMMTSHTTETSVGMEKQISHVLTVDEYLQSRDESVSTQGSSIGDDFVEVTPYSYQPRGHNIRLALSEKTQETHHLNFGSSNALARLEIANGLLIESIGVQDVGGSKPVQIERRRSDILAFGCSPQRKVVQVELKDDEYVTYYVSETTLLNRLLQTLEKWLTRTYFPMSYCLCTRCSGISHYSHAYMDSMERMELYACLLCTTWNVREVQADRVEQIYAAGGFAVIHSAPQTIVSNDSFYVEVAEMGSAAVTDCVLVSSNGIREVSASASASYEQEVK